MLKEFFLNRGEHDRKREVEEIFTRHSLTVSS